MRKTLTCWIITVTWLFSSQLNAQWQLSQTSSIGSWSMVQKNSSVLAGVQYGIYFSDDYGVTWTLKSCPTSYVRSIVVWDSVIYINGDFDGVYKSLDNGTTWINIDSGITNPSQAWSLTHNDSLLILGTSGSFAGDTACIYISADKGDSWTKVFSLSMYHVFYSIAVSGNEVFAGTLPGGLFYSNDKGATWTQHGGGHTKHIGLAGTNLLGAGGTGVFLSPDKGVSWTNVIPMYSGYSFAVSGSLTFAGTSNGFYYSTDDGYTWINDNNGLPPVTGVISICVVDSFIFISTTNGKIYKRNMADIATSMNDISSANSAVVIYPNPFNNMLNIQKNSIEPAQFTLYNSLGEKIISELLTNKIRVINLFTYSNGIYYYQLASDNNLIKAGKIIKQ